MVYITTKEINKTQNINNIAIEIMFILKKHLRNILGWI